MFMRPAITITGILALTVVLSGCTHKTLTNQNRNQNTNIQPTQTPLATSIPEQLETIESKIDTSNWKTYRNEEYGFEVRYPEEWRVNEVNKNIIGLLPPDRKPEIEYTGDIGFFIKPRINNESVEDVYNGRNGPELFQSATGGYRLISIDGKEAYYFNDVMGLLPSDVVIIPMENWFIEIDAIDNFEVFEELLKTVSFK